MPAEIGATVKETGDCVAGLLLPAFALKSEDDLGIGDTRSLRKAVDWMAEMGMGFLQLLPINETGRDNSPYNAISSIAIEPTTLDVSPDSLEDLRLTEFESITGEVDLLSIRSGPIDYAAVKKLKTDILWAAFETFWNDHYRKGSERDQDFHQFSGEERQWLGDYCLYRLLMDMEGGSAVWTTWHQDYNEIGKARAFVDTLLELNATQTEKQLVFYAYVQWIAAHQWDDLRQYAESKGVELMGDMPYGISYYSADVFCNPEFFVLDWYGGAPPETNFKDDEFTQKWGQNWGIPLYRWDVLEQTEFEWWKRRVRKLAAIFSSFRIDHALGFYRIYSFPWRPERNAEFLRLSESEARSSANGHLPRFSERGDDSEEDRNLNRRAGEKLLGMVKEAAGGAAIIAEDLGHVPEYVEPSLEALGIPGMKVPQWQETNGHPRSGSSYPFVSMATYATHDHEPLRTQWKSLRRTARTEEGNHEAFEAKRALNHLAEFAGLSGDPLETNYTEATRESLLRALFSSASKYASVMVTDLLGTEQRFNVPGVVGENNWTTRMDCSIEDLMRVKKWKKLTARTRDILAETNRLAP